MMVDMEQDRLKRIKTVKVNFGRTKCQKCGSQFVHEKMWHVSRWGTNKWKYDWYYCKHCLPTRNDVLNEVDNDDCPFGIYGVDPYPYNPNKKSTTGFSKFPDPNGHPVLVTEENE